MHKTNTLQRSLSLVSLSETNYYMWNPLKARYNESATPSVLVVYTLLCLFYLEFVYGSAGVDLAHETVVHLLVQLQIVCASGCCRITRTKRVSRQSRRQAVYILQSPILVVWFSALLPPKRSPNVKIRHYHRKDRPILPPCTTRRARDGNIWVFFRSVAKSWLFWQK